MPLAEVLTTITARVRDVLGPCEAYVYLIEGDRLVVRAADGTTAKYVGLSLGRGEGVAGRVWETGEPLVVDDYATWEGRSSKIAYGDVRAVVGLPLKGSDGIVGVMGVYLLQEGRRFTAAEVRALEGYAQMASLALDHARLTAALRESEARFRLAFEHAPTGRGVTTPDGRWVLVNPTLCALAGRTMEEMLTLRSADITHPEDREATVAGLQNLLAGKLARYEHVKRYLRPDGSAVWVQTVVSLVRDHAGRPLYFIGDALDLTARRAAEEAARQQTVTRDLVRRLLQDLSGQAHVQPGLMRDLGRRLAKGVPPGTLDDYARAFASMGLGTLVFAGRETGRGTERFVFEGDDLLERATNASQPTCHLALGFVEGAVGAISGKAALGTELQCQSQGHKRCKLIVKEPLA